MNIKQYVGIDSLYKKPNGEEMPHREIFRKVVTDIGLDLCAKYMPASIDELREALKEDPYLNTIPLAKWDRMSGAFGFAFRRIGVTYHTLSDAVCTLKEAARMLVEREDAKAAGAGC